MWHIYSLLTARTGQDVYWQADNCTRSLTVYTHSPITAGGTASPDTTSSFPEGSATRYTKHLVLANFSGWSYEERLLKTITLNKGRNALNQLITTDVTAFY